MLAQTNSAEPKEVFRSGFVSGRAAIVRSFACGTDPRKVKFVKLRQGEPSGRAACVRTRGPDSWGKCQMGCEFHPVKSRPATFLTPSLPCR